MTHSRPAIRELLADNGLAPRRDLGQNFVVDPNTVRRIAGLARVGPGDHVVEIGAGLGSLTLALAETGASVTAVEVDAGVVRVLRSVLDEAGARAVEVVHADAMTADWTEILDPAVEGGWTLVANLPYNVGTPLVCDVLDFVPHVGRILVMVQREVAERFAARPGDTAFGSISVKASYWGTARIVGHVPATVFHPRPNVESALVEITRRTPPDVDTTLMFDLVRQAFGQRRKMLRKSLGSRVTAQQFADAGIVETDRPEQVGADQWVRLTHVVGATT